MNKYRIIWTNKDGSDVAHGFAQGRDENEVAHMIDSGQIRKPMAHIVGYEIHKIWLVRTDS